MELNERIKRIRKELKLTQKNFGESIGISGPSVAKLESGENNPSKQTISLICSKFNVNPEWLKDGEDVPMFLDITPEDQLLVDQSLSNESELTKSIFRAFSVLDDSEWEALKKIVDKIRKAGR